MVPKEPGRLSLQKPRAPRPRGTKSQSPGSGPRGTSHTQSNGPTGCPPTCSQPLIVDSKVICPLGKRQPHPERNQTWASVSTVEGPGQPPPDPESTSGCPRRRLVLSRANEQPSAQIPRSCHLEVPPKGWLAIQLPCTPAQTHSLGPALQGLTQVWHTASGKVSEDSLQHKRTRTENKKPTGNR